MASTLNLRSFLQTELQALSAEARRKHPEVKEAAERVLVVLRGIPSSSSAADVSQSLRQSDEIVRPFALACQSAAAGGSGGRMCSIAMQGLQQLVAARAVSGRSIAEVLRTLQLASAMGVEVQVKVLQMVLPLVTQYAEHVAGEELVQALHVCLALQRSRDAVVANTAAAMLRQAVEEVFDRVARDADEQTDGVRQQHEHDAQFVLQDLCLLAADHEPVLLQRAAGVDKRLVLELLEALLANHAAVIAAHGKMTQVLRERLAPFLVGFFADAGPFAEAVRCTRMLVLFVRHMHAAMAAECEVFLGILARLLGGSPQGPAYCRVLAAEAVRQLAESGRLALRLFARYDGREGADDCHVVCDLVAAVARAAAEVPAEADAAVSETCGVRTPLGALLDKAEAPAVPAAYVAGQAQQALWALAAALAGGVLPWRTRHIDAEEVFDESLGAATDDVSAAAAVLAAQTWPALLAALDGALGGRLDDGMFSRAVAAAGQLACVWGALGLQDARDAAIELLCSAARATDGAAVGGRQVQCVREAVRCAKYLAAVMRQAWAGVLRTVQAVDEALHVPDGGAALEDVRGEVERMRALVARAGPPAYLWAMRALAGLGCAAAGVPAPDGAQLPTGEPLAAGELFSTAELRALAVAADGGGRALVADAEAWRLVSQHLLLLATHAQTPSAARTQACSALADVVLAGMEQVGQAEASGGSPSDAFGDLVASGAAQRSMLQPLALLMQGPAEARRVGLDTLQRVLQAAGHSVGAAWPVVFDVVDPAVAEDAGLARVAFGCVQLVCSDHLADLPPECVRRCIGVLQGFGGQRADLNVALTAVGQAWALCDFFHARPADDAGLPGAPLASAMLERQDAAALVEQWRTEPLAPGGGRTHAVLWALLLHALAMLARDRRHAVRLSATQTLFRALDAHGAGFPPWLCDAALWAVILPLAQHALDSRAGVLLGAAPDAADAGADEAMRRVAEQSGVVAEDPGRLARRQWDESVATAMLGLAAAWRALGGSVGRREDAWARVWGLVARLAAGDAGQADAGECARLRTRASMQAALECMAELAAGLQAAGAPAAWQAWHAVCLRLLDVPEAAAAGLNVDGEGAAVVRQDTLCALLELGTRVAAALRDAGLLADAECRALLHVARAMLVFPDAPPANHASSAEAPSRLQHLALDAVHAVGQVHRSLALGELALLAAAPYAIETGEDDAAAACASAAVVVRAREAFAGQVARARVLDVRLPGLAALGVAAVGRLAGALQQQREEGLRVLLAGGVWRDGVAAMGLHMVRPLADGGVAAECFVEAVPPAMLRMHGEGCEEEDAGAMADAWAAVGVAVAGALGMAPASADAADAAGRHKVQVLAGFSGGDRQLHVLDAVVSASLEYVSGSLDGRPAEVSDYWDLLLNVLAAGAGPHGSSSSLVGGDSVALWRHRLSLACFRWLFHMCDAGVAPETPAWVSRDAAHVLVDRCQTVVRAYMDDRRLLGGRAPMPEGQAELLQNVLEQVASLECREDALLAQEQDDSARGAGRLRMFVLAGRSALVFALYGCLVDLLAVEHAAQVVCSVQLCLRRVERVILG